jgi:hypothetical protein
MHDRDTLHRFLFERYPIRGHLVHLDAAWRPRAAAAIRPWLRREAATAAVLLAAT